MDTKVSGKFESADIAELCAAKIRRRVRGVNHITISREKVGNSGAIVSFMMSNSSINYIPLPIFEVANKVEEKSGALLNIYCDKTARRKAEQQIISMGGFLS